MKAKRRVSGWKARSFPANHFSGLADPGRSPCIRPQHVRAVVHRHGLPAVCLAAAHRAATGFAVADHLGRMHFGMFTAFGWGKPLYAAAPLIDNTSVMGSNSVEFLGVVTRQHWQCSLHGFGVGDAGGLHDGGLGSQENRGLSPITSLLPLECGIFAHGFARARCDDCGHDYFVAFSCKGRGVCPSCNTRRMAETAAHLVDHVLQQFSIQLLPVKVAL